MPATQDGHGLYTIVGDATGSNWHWANGSESPTECHLNGRNIVCTTQSGRSYEFYIQQSGWDTFCSVFSVVASALLIMAIIFAIVGGLVRAWMTDTRAKDHTEDIERIEGDIAGIEADLRTFEQREKKKR